MKERQKALLLNGFIFLAIGGLAGGLAYYLTPQKTRTVIENGGNNDGPVTPTPEETGKDKIINGLVSSAMGEGLSLHLDEASLTHKGEAETAVNVITLDGADLSLAIGGLSLHGIDLKLDAPIDYNGRERSLELGLIDDELYFSIGNLEDDGNVYDLKYKVSTEAYDIVDDGGSIVDGETGGTLQYEYGDLDWVISDVLSILSDGEIDVPFPNIADLIGSSGGSSGFDANAILSSMNSMTESQVDGFPYFTWNLELGDLKLPIGLKGDSDYNLVGIDLPAVGGEDSIDLGSGLSLQLHASIAANAIDWSYPEDYSSYRRLENSLGLFEGIAEMVAHPQFGIDADLTLNHHEEAIPASTTTIGKNEIDENLRLTLDAQVDMDLRKFNAAEASLGLYVDDDEEAAQTLSTAILPSDGGHEAYVNLNDVMKAKTSKATNDAIIGQIAEMLSSDSQGQVTEAQIGRTGNVISKVASYLQGDLITGAEEGHYEAALDCLQTIKNEDNRLLVRLNLDPIGIRGHVVLTLDGNEGNSLLNIEFESVSYSSFTLSGSLKTVSFVAPSLSDEEKEGYDELTHLSGTIGQIGEIANSKSATLSLSGSLLDPVKTEIGGGKAGISFDGTMAFDVNDVKGGLDLTISELNENYRNTHAIKADLYGETDLTGARLSYSSDNGEIDGENPYNMTNPVNKDGLKAKLPFASLSPLMESLSGLTQADDRFGRLLQSFSSVSASSLLGQIASGNYFSLLRLHVIEDASLEGDTHVFTLNGAALGLEGKMTIEVDYAANPVEGDPFQEGGFESLSIKGQLAGKDLIFTIGLEATNASEADLAPLGDVADSEFADLSGISYLGSSLLDTLTLGAVDHKGVSTYSISAGLDLSIGEYRFSALTINAGIRVEGAKTEVYAELKDMPLIKGVNAPEGMPYFRPHEYEGTRDVAFYYYADGLNPTGEVLLTRDSSYGRLRNVKDSVRLTGAQFGMDPINWVLKYLLGVNESFFESGEEGVAATSTGMMGAPLHLEDLISSFSLTNDEAAPALEVGLSLSALTGMNFLGDAKLGIYGTTALDGQSNSFKAIEKITLDAGIALGGSLNVIGLSLEAKLNNVAGGVYTDGFASAESIYRANFIDAEGQDVSTTFAGQYGHDYRLEESVFASNLY